GICYAQYQARLPVSAVDPDGCLVACRYALANTVHLFLVSYCLCATYRCARHRHDERGHGAGVAIALDRAAFEWPREDVPVAQMAWHWCVAGGRAALVVGARHQVDGRLGLAGTAGARRAPGGAGVVGIGTVVARPTRPGRGAGRVGVLCVSAVDCVGVDQAFSLSPVSKDTYLAGAGLPSVGLAQPGIDQAGILDAADWLDHGAVVAGRFVIGATGVGWTRRPWPQGAG